MSDDAFCIVIKFTLCFLTQCFDLIQYSCGKVELFHCFFIAFKKLDCKPAKIVWITASGNLFLNHRKSFFQFWVEGKRFWCKRFSLSKGQRCFCNLSASFSFQSTGLDNLTAKSLRKFCNVNLISIFADKIHHVQRNYHWHSNFQQLGGQIKISFQIGSVHNVDHRVRMLGDQIVSADNLLQCVWGKGVDAR